MFNVAIPGESLTQPKGNRPYEKPAEFDNPVDAFNNILEAYYHPVTFGNVTKSLIAGVPIEFLVDVITFSGFMSGKYTVDVAELIKPAFFLNILADARDSDIDPIIFSTTEGPDEMDPSDFINMMKELRPEKHAELLASTPLSKPEEPMMEPEEPMMAPEEPMMEPEGSFIQQQGPAMGLQEPMMEPEGQMPVPQSPPLPPQAPPQAPMMSGGFIEQRMDGE